MLLVKLHIFGSTQSVQHLLLFTLLWVLSDYQEFGNGTVSTPQALNEGLRYIAWP
jgi:hypothetical protein